MWCVFSCFPNLHLLVIALILKVEHWSRCWLDSHHTKYPFICGPQPALSTCIWKLFLIVFGICTHFHYVSFWGLLPIICKISLSLSFFFCKGFVSSNCSVSSNVCWASISSLVLSLETLHHYKFDILNINIRGVRRAWIHFFDIIASFDY